MLFTTWTQTHTYREGYAAHMHMDSTAREHLWDLITLNTTDLQHIAHVLFTLCWHVVFLQLVLWIVPALYYTVYFFPHRLNYITSGLKKQRKERKNGRIWWVGTKHHRINCWIWKSCPRLLDLNHSKEPPALTWLITSDCCSVTVCCTCLLQCWIILRIHFSICRCL